MSHTPQTHTYNFNLPQTRTHLHLQPTSASVANWQSYLDTQGHVHISGDTCSAQTEKRGVKNLTWLIHERAMRPLLSLVRLHGDGHNPNQGRPDVSQLWPIRMWPPPPGGHESKLPPHSRNTLIIHHFSCHGNQWSLPSLCWQRH